MNIDNLKNNKRHIPKALLYLSGLLALLIGAKVSAFVINSNQIPENIAMALNSPGRNEENVKKYQLKYTEATDALKKKNLFMPPVSPKQNPVTRVTAVLGDEACISDKWYKIGDKINDAEITGITPNEVTIVWNETESKLKPFDTVIIAASPKQTSSKDGKNKDKKDKKDRKSDEPVQPERMEQNRPMPRPQMSPEERQKRMQEYMKNLSPEDRARMQERMRSRGFGGGSSRGGSNRSRGPGGRR